MKKSTAARMGLARRMPPTATPKVFPSGKKASNRLGKSSEPSTICAAKFSPAAARNDSRQRWNFWGWWHRSCCTSNKARVRNSPVKAGIGWGEVVYSVKTFAAAMLALWIAFTFDFANPYWAMATVYIVSQPLSGAATSKAFYRVSGTLVGALMTLLLVPNLVNTPALLCLALAVWVGLCLFIGLLDRTPRSYLFMLAGYTTAIIGFPCVNNPTSVFDITVQRVQEITLGIVCAAVISRLFFPRHVGPVLTARIEVWLGDAAKWAQDVLSGHGHDEKSRAHAHRMAADTIDLVALAAYLPYDTAPFQQSRQQLIILEQHMTALVPLLSAVGDRVTALQQIRGGLPDLLRSVLADLSDWIAAGRDGDLAAADQLHQTIDRLERAANRHTDWRGLLEFNLCARLHDLVDVWEDCLTLRLAIASGRGRHPAPPCRRRPVRRRTRAASRCRHCLDFWSCRRSRPVDLLRLLDRYWLGRWCRGGFVDRPVMLRILFAGQPIARIEKLLLVRGDRHRHCRVLPIRRVPGRGRFCPTGAGAGAVSAHLRRVQGHPPLGFVGSLRWASTPAFS